MTETFRWEQHFVHQRHPESGCIPWGFEILLRIEGANLDFGDFQERFDLDRASDLPPRNNFNSVSQEIIQQHPEISIVVRDFGQDNGNDKVDAIDTIMSQRKPVLVSIPLEPFDYPGWHVMPVVEKADDTYYFLHSISEVGAPQILTTNRESLVVVHEKYRGGHDITYIESV